MRPGRFISRRVATRLLLLFVLCAFVPLAAIALLSFSQVEGLLLHQGEQRLGAMAKTYGMTLFERLLLASEVGAGLSDSAAHAKPTALLLRTFSWIGVMDAQGVWQPVSGDAEPPAIPPEARARISRNKPVALVDKAGDHGVVLGIPLSPPSAGFAVGEVRPEFLWGPPDELPTATRFCVIEDGSRQLLHCPDSMRTPAPRVLDAQTSSALLSTSWEWEGQRYRARVWPHFMGEGFGTPDWVVVAAQPEVYQLTQAKEFARLFVPVVAIALLLVGWLTVRQSIDIVTPIEKLAAHARGIAFNNFEPRLDLKRDDEFGELAIAFNQMSQRLGRQFASLNALSEIDRLILSTQDTAEVVRTVLNRLREAVGADVLSITLLDRDNPERARTFFRTPEAGENMSIERQPVSPEELAALDADALGKWVELDSREPVPSYLAHGAHFGIIGAYVQPIVWRGEVCGALCLGYRRHTPLHPDERQQVRELSDRVAVAVSSAWRDEQLYQQSHFDALTGMPNRLLFTDRLEREIVRSQREGVAFAVLYVDLDHFKNVNDSFGPGEGDKVLRESARRIERCVRESDTVSRLGGDEFTVLLTRIGHPQEAWLLAETVVAALSQEFNLGEQQCFLSASVGISSYPADGASADDLLKSADTAMYRAKAAGRGQAIFFEEKMNREAVARVTLDRDLRAAIERGELVLHYQPQVELRSGLIRGAEALIRWNHPKHGLVSPLRFIPLAEESGFIEQIGRWTLERACAQMQEWRARGLGVERISVNVSPRQFRKRGLDEFIRHTVRAAGLPPECIEIEITEGLLIERGEAVEGVLRALAEMGHRIALDDFGTGFSSMAYLQRFPVHTIKIDRVFIERLERSTENEAIVAAIIAMSHALGKRVIAEGVETPAQLAMLSKLECDEIQGFLVSPGLPAAAFEQLLAARSVAVAT